MCKPTLVILAAGWGTRYGGLKQIDSVGPNGEILIEYSIYDALSASFGRLVFVIQHSFEDAFKDKIGAKFDGLVETAYAYQEIDSYIEGVDKPPGRKKPWGTGHALLVAYDVVSEPFAVINADDYYGRSSIKAIGEYLCRDELSGSGEYAMVGYVLENALSDYGWVSRGLCEVDGEGFLKDVVERKKVVKTEQGIQYLDADGGAHRLTGTKTVSMNLWGFRPSIFDGLRKYFHEFLAAKGQDNNCEFYIPDAVEKLIKSGTARVKVLRTDDRWFGITYKQDKGIAQECIRKLISERVYPSKLWD